MTQQPLSGAAARGNRARRKPLRRQRWWRWLLASVGAVALIVVVGAAAFIKLSPSATALTLPPGPVSRPAGQLGGRWDVGAGSVAGFRVQQSALGFSNYVGGQTRSVSGTIVITGTTVTAASFRINLTTIEVSGKKQPQLAASLGTRDHPVASFTLREPVPLGQRFAAGYTVTATASGQLTMNGSSRPVTVTLVARRAGQQLQTAGSIPVTFSRWDIAQPAGAGLLGGLASHGAAEFLLLLSRPTS
jgi:polyisoprenoid-binding protein YceI